MPTQQDKKESLQRMYHLRAFYILPHVLAASAKAVNKIIITLNNRKGARHPLPSFLFGCLLFLSFSPLGVIGAIPMVSASSLRACGILSF